jgi:hypothetical protein
VTPPLPSDSAPGAGAPGPWDPDVPALRAQYLTESPERVRELSAALGRLRTHDPSALGELQRCFQALAASARPHGLADVASRAAAGGGAAAALALTPLPLPRADLVTLEQHVLAVAEAFRLAQPRPSDAGTP